MLRTGQPSTYSRHTDYYQLWLENKKEIQKLESNLLDSKKIIRTLHLKLTDILKSIKIFEENQDLNNSNEGQKSSHGSFTILPVNDATIALEVEGDQRNLQNPRSDLVEVNLKQQTQTDNGNATLNILPLAILPGSVHTTILPESVSASNDSAAYTLVPLGDLGHSNTASGHNRDSKPSNLLENRSEFVEVNFDQDIPVENERATEPFITLPVSLHSNLEFGGVQNEDINKLEGRRKQKLITKSDLLALANVQEEAKTGSTERPDGHHNLPVTLECVKTEPAEELDNNDYIVDNVPEVILHAGGGQEMVLQDQKSGFGTHSDGQSIVSEVQDNISTEQYDQPGNMSEIWEMDCDPETIPAFGQNNSLQSKLDYVTGENQGIHQGRPSNVQVGTQRAQQQPRRNTIVSAETKRIALKRISQGESQTKIAKELGVVQSTVAYWVKNIGKDCSPDIEEEAVERNLDPEFIVSDGQSSSFSEQDNPKGISSKRTFRTQDNQEELQSGLKLTGIECSNLDFISPDVGSGQHSSFPEQKMETASERRRRLARERQRRFRMRESSQHAAERRSRQAQHQAAKRKRKRQEETNRRYEEECQKFA